MAESTEIDPGWSQELVTTWGAFADPGRAPDRTMAGVSSVDVPRDEIEALADLAERGGIAAAERLRALLLEPVAGPARRLPPPDDARRRAARQAGARPWWSMPTACGCRWISCGRSGARSRTSCATRSTTASNPPTTAAPPASPRPATSICARAATDDLVTIEVADDGGGINWDRVRAKALAAGLPALSHDELVRALFSDGVSTADAVSETSGRGVGLAAVLAAVTEARGRVEVDSELTRGHPVRVHVPAGRRPRRGSAGRPAGRCRLASARCCPCSKERSDEVPDDPARPRSRPCSPPEAPRAPTRRSTSSATSTTTSTRGDDRRPTRSRPSTLDVFAIADRGQVLVRRRDDRRGAGQQRLLDRRRSTRGRVRADGRGCGFAPAGSAARSATTATPTRTASSS